VQPTGDRIYELLDDEESQKISRPILFKMHGSVDRDPNKDCYLITEEDYVDFLGRDKGHYVPLYVEAMMRNKDFLFLGYSLADWNVRVILRKLLKGTATARRYRAIATGISPREQEVWEKQGLNIHAVNLMLFAEKLTDELKRMRS
jgi:SIR2-like domain